MVPTRLHDGARVVVIGGGPAGSFFSTILLQEAARCGRQIEVQVIEKKISLARGCNPRETIQSSCNYCAGGLSPPLCEALQERGYELPPGIVQNRVHSITIQSHWKNIELRVPQHKQMYCVYRGSRPRARHERDLSLDSYLLGQAAACGARIVPGAVCRLERTPDDAPLVIYREAPDGSVEQAVRADLLVYAGGVNDQHGIDASKQSLASHLQRMMPGFVPPRTRRTLIAELEVSPAAEKEMAGELYFVLYGSRKLRLEMASLMPKGRFVTAVLIGPDIDERPHGGDSLEILESFLSLPQIRRLFPGRLARSAMSCLCHPRMVVGCARRPWGHRVAAIGDMATARLYKDGIFSAYQGAVALADAVLHGGVDADSLQRAYWPAIARMKADQRHGKNVFRCTAVMFRQPSLSRITYQAVLSERKTKRHGQRKLEQILWRIASGDDSYRNIMIEMFRPSTLLRVASGGVGVTLRNYLTEKLFGLDWRGFGRFPTGIYHEEFRDRLDQLARRLDLPLHSFGAQRMYSIKIRAPAALVYDEMGRFGDPDRGFLKPRFVTVKRESGAPNQVGATIRYHLALRFLSFSMRLEASQRPRQLVYRVLDGFAAGGVLIFDVEDLGARGAALSILLTFSVRAKGHLVGRVAAVLLRRLFPLFVHDVLWNHALCQFKSSVEDRVRRVAPQTTGKRVGCG